MKTATRHAFRTEYPYRDRVLIVSRGNPLPLGANPMPNGVNFALVCRHGTAVWLVLSEPCEGEVLAEIPLDDLYNRTGDHWHIRVDGLPEEFCYGYRVDGPKGNGHRFDPSKILLDPYSRALSCGRPWGTSGNLPRRSLMNESMIERNGVDQPPDPARGYDHLRAARARLHDRSLVGRAPSRHLRRPGREDRLPEVAGGHGGRAAAGGRVRRERLPVRQPADRRAAEELLGLQPDRLRRAEGGLRACNPERSEPWDEFCDMVDAFHRRGIEVFLDIVFNHTAEGGEGGPTYNFRGLDNSLYYMLDERGRYLNFSRLRQHVQQRPPGRPQLPDLVPAELGRGGRRRWVSLRPGLGLRPRPAGQRDRQSTGGEPDLGGFAALRHQADRRALGRGRALPGGDVPRRGAMVGLEWPLSRRCSQVLARRAGHDLGAGHPDLRQRRSLRAAADRCTRSTSSPATTASRSTTWSPTTRSTTRPTAKATATATTPTGAGTAARRDRRTIPRSIALRQRQVRNLMATLLISQGVPMILGGRRVPPHPERQQQRLVPGQPHELG